MRFRPSLVERLERRGRPLLRGFIPGPLHGIVGVGGRLGGADELVVRLDESRIQIDRLAEKRRRFGRIALAIGRPAGIERRARFRGPRAFRRRRLRCRRDQRKCCGKNQVSGHGSGHCRPAAGLRVVSRRAALSGRPGGRRRPRHDDPRERNAHQREREGWPGREVGRQHLGRRERQRMPAARPMATRRSPGHHLRRICGRWRRVPSARRTPEPCARNAITPLIPAMVTTSERSEDCQQQRCRFGVARNWPAARSTSSRS